MRGGRPVAQVRVLGTGVGGIGNARQRAVEIGYRLLPLEESPKSNVHAHDERDYGSDGAHERITTRGRIQRPEPVPKVRPKVVCLHDTLSQRH